MQWLDGWQLHSGVTKPCLADNYARNVGIFIALRLINPCTSMPAKSDIIAPKIRLLSFCHSTASVDQENKQKMQAQIRHVFFLGISFWDAKLKSETVTPQISQLITQIVWRRGKINKHFTQDA